MPTDRQTDRETIERLIILKIIQDEVTKTGSSKVLDDYIKSLESTLMRP